MKRYLVFFLVFSFIIAGCTNNSTAMPNIPTIESTKPTENIFDVGFFSEKPCSPPCMFNITPGISKTTQMNENLVKFNIFQTCNENQNKNTLEYYVECTPDLWFIHDGENVEEISFTPHPDITLEQIIEKYGDPYGVNLTRFGFGEMIFVKVIVYASQNFVIHFIDPGNVNTNNSPENGEIYPEMTVRWIDYLSDEDLDYFLISECTIPWNGYRNYVSDPMGPSC